MDLSAVLGASRAGIFPTVLRQVLLAANAVPQLRRRIHVEDGEDVIVEHERVDCTCTVARADGSFSFCHFPFPEAGLLDDVPERVAAAATTTGLDLGRQDRDDILYLTCLPWLALTSMQHAETGDPLDCVPRIAWGKVEDGRVTVCLTAHHSLVDGVHAAQFYEKLSEPSVP